MELLLRAALLDWLAADPDLAEAFHSIAEDPPAAAAPPWIALAASAAADWGAKERRGAEVRVALEVHQRGDTPADLAAPVEALHRRIADFPFAHDGFELASLRFLRSRHERRERIVRATLIEYRFRIFAN